MVSAGTNAPAAPAVRTKKSLRFIFHSHYRGAPALRGTPLRQRRTALLLQPLQP
jgi:hypothetical protein